MDCFSINHCVITFLNQGTHAVIRHAMISFCKSTYSFAEKQCFSNHAKEYMSHFKLSVSCFFIINNIFKIFFINCAQSVIIFGKLWLFLVYFRLIFFVKFISIYSRGMLDISGFLNGASSRIRTCDPQLRRLFTECHKISF